MEAVARSSDLYTASQSAFAETRLEAEPPWLGPLRRDAFERFLAAGLPTTRDEAWRYTSAAPIAKTAFRFAADGIPPASRLDPGRLPGGDGARAVFVDGRFAPELSGGGFGQASVTSLRHALKDHPRDIEPHLGKIARFQANAFTALNSAYIEDGAFVVIPDGAVLKEPIHLVFVSSAGDEPVAFHPRNLIVAGAHSQARIIETYIGDGGSDQLSHPGLPEAGAETLTNAVTEIACGEGAILEHTKLQREALSAFHVHRIAVSQGRASRFDSHNLCFGSALARTDIDVLFQAEGSECALNGLFVTDGSQHVDNHTTIDHAKPHCTSRELYKGILAGRSRGVFHGKILVRPDAQKTDAIQTNKNLLLSREALVNSTPALEILADDVKCRHGSTIGQLDANSLFYLRARGIGEQDARAMLTYAFAADLAARIRVPWVREEVEAFLVGRLASPSEPA